ncbi:serine/threonine-protein kinase OSR1-like isoform X2 [Phoenix dactylifera]|uniref:Serine/threonine-protein kinase OSR1-like isoform X2 n=1 Tax=Phoenix dactylifera TaxID=42345 RepID=A0A8B8J4Q9_PHODC|nr:serine/threonine-protein kinase OSR1-like isoform X2 [Phoenix dactylifera]
MERKKYPIRAEDYELFEIVGEGASAAVHRARCIPFDEIVAIKVLDFERQNSDLNNISREAQTMILIDHPNVLKAHCSFVNDHNLWVVMPYMSGGSCLHIMKSNYPNGFEEVVIATVLREALKGLVYLHRQGHIHRDVKAGNILVDACGEVKLGDFGVSACLFDSADRQRMRNTFVGTPCWMAPEVMEPKKGYDFKADIWSFGITALELAHGHAPFSSQPPMKVLLMTLQNAPPSLDNKKDKKFSKSFKHMIAMCLVKDPSRRPTAEKLLKQPFFKQARSHDYIVRKILEGLPSLGDRFQALKQKEADLFAQKKMLDGEKEEMSQNEYKRGISSWNFDMEDLKAQASLIPENKENVPGQDPEGCPNSLFELEPLHESLPLGMPPITSCSIKDDVDVDNDGNLQKKVDPLPSPGQSAKFQRVRSNVSKSEYILNGQNSQQNSLQVHGNEIENTANCELDNNEKHWDDMFLHFRHERKLSTSSCSSDIIPSCRGESVKQCNLLQNTENCNGWVCHAAADLQIEATDKASKSAASNADDLDEKSKVPVVQQRGRFKVTSENVDLDKALPSLGLPKSHSVQVSYLVITQLPSSTLPSPSDAAPVVPSWPTLPQLHYILQTNILQRDNILSLMKQVSTGDSSATRLAEGLYIAASTPTTEKTLLEASHEREKELLQDITDLQWRLICTQEELQRLKTKNAQV